MMHRQRQRRDDGQRLRSSAVGARRRLLHLVRRAKRYALRPEAGLKEKESEMFFVKFFFWRFSVFAAQRKKKVREGLGGKNEQDQKKNCQLSALLSLSLCLPLSLFSESSFVLSFTTIRYQKNESGGGPG